MSETNLPERKPNETPGEFLGRILKRANTNPHRLSKALDGEVSATTIRTYISDTRNPPGYSLPNLARIAGALGPYGPAVLRAFGEEEAASGLEIEHEARTVVLSQKASADEVHALTYRGRALTAEEETAAAVLIDLIRLRGDTL